MAGLVGAIGGLVLGRHIDAGHGERAVWLAFASVAGTTLLRAAEHTENAAPGNASPMPRAPLVGLPSTSPTLMTAVYNQAKLSPCPFRFHVATEGGWDRRLRRRRHGLAAALLSAIGRAIVGYGILLSLAGAALSLIVLQRYYTAPCHAATAPACPIPSSKPNAPHSTWTKS